MRPASQDQLEDELLRRDAVRDEPTGAPSLMTRGATALAALAAAAFAVVIAVTGVFGQWVRPISDDYCTASKERDWGLVTLVHQFYYDLNGRLGNAFASGTVYVGGGYLTKILPTLLMLGLAGGLFASVVVVGRRYGLTTGRAAVIAALAGTGCVATAVWAAKNTYAIIYWSSGSISHTLPSVLAVLYVAIAVAVAGRHRVATVLVCILGVVLGFAAATTSEAFAATGATICVVVIAYLLVHRRRRGAAMWSTVSPLVGLVVGILVLVTSPGARARQQLPNTSDLGVLESAKHAVRVLPDVLRLAFNSQLVVPALAVGVVVGLLLPTGRLSRATVVWLLAACTILPFVMAYEVTVALGLGYGGNGWRFSRVWEDFTIPSIVAFMLLAAVVTALASGWLDRRRAEAPWGRPVATAAGGVVLAVAAAGIAWAVSQQVDQEHQLSTTMRHRASLFDQQAAQLAAERTAGHLVVTFTPHPIAGLAEPTRLPAYRDWVAGCAAVYFHLDGILKPGSNVARPASLVIPP